MLFSDPFDQTRSSTPRFVIGEFGFAIEVGS